MNALPPGDSKNTGKSKKEAFRQALCMLTIKDKKAPSKTPDVLENLRVQRNYAPSDISLMSNKNEFSLNKPSEPIDNFFGLQKNNASTLNFKDHSFGSLNPMLSNNSIKLDSKNMFSSFKGVKDSSMNLQDISFEKHINQNTSLKTFSPNIINQKNLDFQQRNNLVNVSPISKAFVPSIMEKKKNLFDVEPSRTFFDSLTNHIEDRQSSLDPSFCDPTANLFETPGNPPIPGLNIPKIISSQCQVNNFVTNYQVKVNPPHKPGLMKQPPNLPPGKRIEPLFSSTNPQPQNIPTSIFATGKTIFGQFSGGSSEIGFKQLGISPKREGFISENNSQLSAQKRESNLNRVIIDNVNLGKRNQQEFQNFGFNDYNYLGDQSEVLNSKFISIEKKGAPGKKLESRNLKKMKYLSHTLQPKGDSETGNQNPNAIQKFESYTKNSKLINQNRVSLELGMYFIPDPNKLKIIEKSVSDMKTSLLKKGIRLDKAILLNNTQKKVLFDDRLGTQKFNSHNKSLYSKSYALISDGRSALSSTIFDETFYNQYLLKNDSFLNVIYNTFLFNLKNESNLEPFKKYLETMDELKTWMFQEFDEKKGFSNAEQFMKYFNLQVPINQQYFSGLSNKDKIKLICFFFCKFFNRNVLMTQFGDVWPQVKIHHNYKTHSKM